ncbi:MAG: oxidoreductase [Lysobacteraceae bacterium]|nr:MAG: oxidoreductase [Xanthomonadaceae bacterium]
MNETITTTGSPHYRVCNLCEAMCGIEVTVSPSDDGADPEIKIRPDKDDPFSRGAMCPKASALAALHTDPSRLRQPHKRVGDQWQAVSWDEAYATVETELKRIRKQYGANAIAGYLGNPTVHNLGMMVFVKALFRAIGTRSVFSATSVDQLPHHFAALFMFGHEMRIPVPDIERTDYMLIMGANPVASNGSLMSAAGTRETLKAIDDRGGKVVVIDPRRTETAKIATEHHFITPGSDVYFLLAMLHVVFRDNLVNPGVLAEHIRGLDALQPLVEPFAPETVAAITAIDAETIEGITQAFCAEKRAVLYGRMGLSTQVHGGLCQWLINTINVVTGHFDTPGGMMFPTPAVELVRHDQQRKAFGRWRSRVHGLKEFAGELPVATLADEMLTDGEGQIKALITICGNPVLSTPNGKRLEQALPEAEFVLCVDNYINETTRHANLILPTPMGLEVDHYDLVFNVLAVRNNAKFSQALFPPDKDRPYDWQVLKELASRMAKKKPGWMARIRTPRRVLDWGLMLGPYGRLSHPKRWFSGLSLNKLLKSPHGIDLGPLQRQVPQCLITPDRRINLVADELVNRLREITEQELPTLVEQAQQSSEGFLLIGRRMIGSNNSWMHQVPKLSRSKSVRCTAMINPGDAERLGISDGEQVAVSSRVGQISLPAELSDTMMPGVLCIPHGFGHTRKGTRVPHAEAVGGASVNDITDHRAMDALTGNAAFSGLRVDLHKVPVA